MPDSIAFVAGATGYTGREVVRVLAERGVRTVAHVRPDSSRLETWRTRFGQWGAEVDTTAWELEAMTRTLTELCPTHVFALLGTTRARASGEGMTALEAYEKIDYGLTAMLIDAAAACGSQPRFIYLSTGGVAPNPRNPYLAARWKAEEHLRSTDLPWTIARPSFITGSDRDESRPLERVSATVGNAMLGLAGFFGASKLRARWSSMDNTTLARGLVRAALDPDDTGRILYADTLRE